MKTDLRKISKKRKLEECYQNLEQAKASNNKFQIKIWTDIIRKLENDKKDTTN
jgi:hypothetical protein